MTNNYSQFKIEKFLKIVHSKWMVSSVYSICTVAGFLFVYLYTNVSLVSFIKPAFVVSFACFLLANSMYNLNDLLDKSSDQANNREKPLSVGTIDKNDIIITSAVLSSISLVLLGSVNLITLLIGLLCVALGVFYSVPPIRLKDKVWGKTTTITLVIMLSTIIGSFSLQRGFYPLLVMTISVGIFVELITHSHDIRDLKGDKKDGCKTIPVIMGKKPTIILASVGYVSLIAFSLFGFYLLNFNYLFLIGTFFIVLLGFRKIKSIWSQNPAPEDYKRMRITNRISIVTYVLLFSLAPL